MFKILFLASGVMFIAWSSLMGQTPEELTKKYGTSERFIVRPRVIMHPIYNRGTLCGAQFQENHFPDNRTTILDIGMEPEELFLAIESVAPEASTGTGKPYGYRRVETTDLSQISISGLQINVSAAAGSESTISSTQKPDRKSLEGKDLSLKSFLAAFGTIETARIWWSRRDNCHDR